MEGPQKAPAQRRLRCEEPPDRRGSAQPRRRPCGPSVPTDMGSAEPVADVGCSAPSGGSVGDCEPSSSLDSSGVSLGPSRCDALHRRVRRRTDEGPPASSDGEVGVPRRTDRPRELHALHRHEAGEQALQWRPPEWLYLPHLGIGDGSQFLRDVGNVPPHGAGDEDESSCMVSLTLRGAGACDVARAQCMPGAECAGRPRANVVGSASGEGQEGPGDHGATADVIRGQVEADLQLPGASAQGSSRHLEPRDLQIRGRGTTPGAADRLRERLAARHSTIRRSLDDHAERVAAKRARLADAPAIDAQPSAACRLAALRARVAARSAAQADAGGASDPGRRGAHLGQAAQHAAARVAEDGGGGPA